MFLGRKVFVSIHHIKIGCIILALLILLEFVFNFTIHYNVMSGLSALWRVFMPSKKENLSSNHLRRLLTGRGQHGNHDNKGATLLPLCKIIPPDLQGPVKVSKKALSYRQLEYLHSHLAPGGRWFPHTCTPRHHVAIIIPYRQRPSHLKIFLRNIHSFLRKQEIDYGIYVVELVPNITFNRALLFNIGFMESLKIHDYTCFIFHDVDLIPEDDRNMYTCAEEPRHMSVAIDKLKYRLPYTRLFGGVSALSKEQFLRVNGFSNMYFGWGGEDDDMYNRIHSQKFSIIRFSPSVARYKMLSHAKAVPNPERLKLLYEGQKRLKTDGLNSLQYEVLKIEDRKLFTWILVTVDEQKIMSDGESSTAEILS